MQGSEDCLDYIYIYLKHTDINIIYYNIGSVDMRLGGFHSTHIHLFTTSGHVDWHCRSMAMSFATDP